MFRKLAVTDLVTLTIGTAALGAASLAGSGPAAAFGWGDGPGYGPPAYGWRPPPPAFHGYWGQRRWQRYNDGYDFRSPPPPPPRYGYGYGYGWR